MNKISLTGFSLEELKETIKELGESGFRANQLYSWLIKSRDFDEMTNLGKGFRDKLKDRFITNPIKIEDIIGSKIDETEKLLYSLPDGNLIEGVLMRYHHGDTICLSTQVGCRMGCAFCASTLDGCVRNLTAAEMLGQILAVNRYLESKPEERKIHNIVLMGSGEPLDNYDEVLKFLRLVNAKEGLNISLRNVSLSTCGLVPNIIRLANEQLPVTLCISLHAPNDLIRNQIMPISKVYKINDVINACKYYIEKTGRRVIFEYSLIKGVNDSEKVADELSTLVKGFQCHVNIIALNEVKERNLHAPTENDINTFINRLKQKGVSVTRRREMGDDIEGACGQLRRNRLNTLSEV